MMKKRVIRLTESNVEKLVKRIIKEGGKETALSSSFSFDDFDNVLNDLDDLQFEVGEMLDNMSDLGLEDTEEYDELNILESDIGYNARNFDYVFRELSDAYDELEVLKFKGDEEEVEYLAEHIEDLEAEAMGIYSVYEEFRDDFDRISKMDQKPSGGRKRIKKHENQ